MVQRNRNALYSRRSYHKQKLLAASLSDEVAALEKSNAEALALRQQLEMLLQQASLIVAMIEGANSGGGMNGMCFGNPVAAPVPINVFPSPHYSVS